MNKPTNDYEALCLALELAVTAQTRRKYPRLLRWRTGHSLE